MELCAEAIRRLYFSHASRWNAWVVGPNARKALRAPRSDTYSIGSTTVALSRVARSGICTKMIAANTITIPSV